MEYEMVCRCSIIVESPVANYEFRMLRTYANMLL